MESATNNIISPPISPSENPTSNQPPGTSNQPQQFHKIKPILSKSTKWRCREPSDITYINKYKPKMLHTLEISQLNHQRIKTNVLQNLLRALADAKIIYSLRIPKKDPFQYDENTKCLNQILNFSNHFHKLNVYYNDGPEYKILNKNSINSLLRLQRCKRLSSFEIQGFCHEETRNRILHRLSQQLRCHTKLKALELHLNSMGPSRYKEILQPDDDPNAPLLKFKYSRIQNSNSTISIF